MSEIEVNERIAAVDNQVGTDTDNIDYISAIKEMTMTRMQNGGMDDGKGRNHRTRWSPALFCMRGCGRGNTSVSNI